MATTSLPRGSSAVRCAICGRLARRGTTLCEQCKAAVERARHVQKVSSEFLPHPVAVADAGPLPGVFAPLPPRAQTAHGVESATGGWGAYATLVAFGIAVCLTGYLALGELEVASNVTHDPLTSPPAPARRGADADGVVGSSPAVDEALAVAHADASEVAARTEPGARGQPDRRSVRESKQAGNVTASSAPDAGPDPGPPQDAAMAAAPAPQVVQETPEPVPDRQQLLATALSRCERENAVVGLFCKERARLQYCDGQWGTAPQCPVGVASSNTR